MFIAFRMIYIQVLIARQRRYPLGRSTLLKFDRKEKKEKEKLFNQIKNIWYYNVYINSQLIIRTKI